MENPQLDYREQLARLYEARLQLDIDDTLELMALIDVPPEANCACEDCKVRAAEVGWRELNLCRACALSRLRVARRLAREAAGGK